MDTYIHKQHRSLSRTPWEVYYARPSPHPLKYIKQFEPFTMLDVDSCSNPKTEIISSLDENRELLNCLKHTQPKNFLRILLNFKQ